MSAFFFSIYVHVTNGGWKGIQFTGLSFCRPIHHLHKHNCYLEKAYYWACTLQKTPAWRPSSIFILQMDFLSWGKGKRREKVGDLPGRLVGLEVGRWGSQCKRRWSHPLAPPSQTPMAKGKGHQALWASAPVLSGTLPESPLPMEPPQGRMSSPYLHVRHTARRVESTASIPSSFQTIPFSPPIQTKANKTPGLGIVLGTHRCSINTFFFF